MIIPDIPGIPSIPDIPNTPNTPDILEIPDIYTYKALFHQWVSGWVSHVLFVPPCHRGTQELDNFPGG